VLEHDYQRELSLRLAQSVCQVEIPRSLQHRLSLRGAEPPRIDERRRFTRFSLPAKVLLEVTTTVRSIERLPEFFTVLTTDASRDGVAFLHVSQLFPGEAPLLWHPVGQLACRVVRCLRHNARCFEIGATFASGPQTQMWLRSMIRDCTAG
jgi:hypothetical protein